MYDFVLFLQPVDDSAQGIISLRSQLWEQCEFLDVVMPIQHFAFPPAERTELPNVLGKLG